MSKQCEGWLLTSKNGSFLPWVYEADVSGNSGIWSSLNLKANRSTFWLVQLVKYSVRVASVETFNSWRYRKRTLDQSVHMWSRAATPWNQNQGLVRTWIIAIARNMHVHSGRSVNGPDFDLHPLRIRCYLTNLDWKFDPLIR